MSEKQDRGYARTSQDIERKYSFGKTFSDMLGLINENREKVDSVESSLHNEILEQSTKLERNTQEIVAAATETVKTELEEEINEVSKDVSELKSTVEMKLDAEAVNIAIEQQLVNGVDRVETQTGYRFDADGLNIRKSNDEIGNTIDNTGMYVKKYGVIEENVLVANKDGVEARDLHAKTYLIIGEGEGKSRFEDYGLNRTGCFWVGG